MNYFVELYHGLHGPLIIKVEAEFLDAIVQLTHTTPVSLLLTANNGYIEEFG